MKKYRIIPALLAVVLVAALGFFLLREAPETGVPFPPEEGITLALATDLHYLAPQLYDNGALYTQMIENADGKTMKYIEELTEAFVCQIIESAPDALILSGDLSFNGERDSHIMLAEKLRRVEAAGIPVLVIPGNHDLDSAKASGFAGDSHYGVDSVNKREFEEIYADLGFREALSRDGDSLSYMAQISPELRVLMVDVNTQAEPGFLDESTLNWIDDQLRLAAEAGAKVVAVSHQNLFQHNSLFRGGFVIGNGRLLGALFEKYGVICNLSGHMHIQHISQIESGLTEIATSSLAVTPNQYGLLCLSESQACYRTEAVNVDLWAASQGLDNPELLHFREYAEAFFRDSSTRKALTRLGEGRGADALARAYSEINLAYFAGRMDTVDCSAQVLLRWNYRDTFTCEYIRSMCTDQGMNFTEYVLGPF